MKRRYQNAVYPIVMIGLLSALMNLCEADDAPIPATLTLSEAVRTAVEQNSDVKAARHQLDIYAARIREAKSAWYPQVYFTETFNQTTNPMWTFGTKLNQESITIQDFDPRQLNDSDAINNFASILSMQWPVYTGGQTQISIEQAKKYHEAMGLALNRTRQNVMAETALGYVGLLLAEKQIHVVAQALDTAKAHLSMVRSRFESGFVVKSDVLRAQVRIAQLEQDRLESESRFNIIQAMLNASMGAPLHRKIQPSTVLEQCKALEASAAQWSAAAMSFRSDLKQLEIQTVIAEQEVAKTKKNHLPTVNLIGSYEVHSEDFSDTADNYTVGAVMRINIFSGYRISSGTDKALASLRRIQSLKENLMRIIRVETIKAFLESESAWHRIEMSRTAVFQAEEGLRIVKSRYLNGLLSIVDLLDAETALQEARTRHFQAMHDYKVSGIRLGHAAGTIDADFF
jgi:outer membrane protein